MIVLRKARGIKITTVGKPIPTLEDISFSLLDFVLFEKHVFPSNGKLKFSIHFSINGIELIMFYYVRKRHAGYT